MNNPLDHKAPVLSDHTQGKAKEGENVENIFWIVSDLD